MDFIYHWTQKNLHPLLCTSICYLFPSYKSAYPTALFIWMVQIIAPFSITYAIQPFIEYGPDMFFPALLINFTIILCTTITALLYKVKRDEI